MAILMPVAVFPLLMALERFETALLHGHEDRPGGLHSELRPN
jgi:hypothetical protein